MMKLAFTLASSLLAASASAQVRVAPPTAGALAWSGAIAGVFGEAGAGGMAQLDSLSLTRLSAPLSDGRLTLVASPQLLNPLVQTLEEGGLDPAQFPDMPLEFRITLLRSAAEMTEGRLSQKVWETVQNTHKGIGRSAYLETAREAELARENSIYLNDRTLEGLRILEDRVKAFAAARDEAQRAFLEDLPAKIAAGAFDAENLLQTEDDGGRTLWKTGGDSPDRAYPTPEAAFDARIETLALMPPGPWSADEARLLKKALLNAMMAGTIIPSRWTVHANDAIDRAADAAEGTNKSRLTAARARIIQGGAKSADVHAVERYYAEAHDRASVWPMRARILATLKTGTKDFPSWSRVRETRFALEDRLGWIGGRAVQTGIVTTILASLLSGNRWNGPAIAILLAAMLTPFVIAVIAFEKRRGLAEFAGSPLYKAMARYFSRKP